MQDADVKAALVYLSRIAHAVEALAQKANPDFRPDTSEKLRQVLKNPAVTPG